MKKGEKRSLTNCETCVFTIGMTITMPISAQRIWTRMKRDALCTAIPSNAHIIAFMMNIKACKSKTKDKSYRRKHISLPKEDYFEKNRGF